MRVRRRYFVISGGVTGGETSTRAKQNGGIAGERTDRRESNPIDEPGSCQERRKIHSGRPVGRGGLRVRNDTEMVPTEATWKKNLFS
jgi:hypothetical protein